MEKTTDQDDRTVQNLAEVQKAFYSLLSEACLF